MLSVFIKELKQFRHCTKCVALLGLSLLLALTSAAMYFSGEKINAGLFGFAANLTAAIYQLAIITVAGCRWKNENGDGTLDIIITTPISPLATACAKTAAASLCCLLSFPVFLTATICFPAQIQENKLFWILLMILLQNTSLCAIVLGCSTFQSKKQKSFDWVMLLTILALMPITSFFYRKAGGTFPNADFLASYAGLAAATAFGISLAVCGASPKGSNRAMPLKLTVVLSAVLLPLVYKYTILPAQNIRTTIAFSLFATAVAVICGSICERTKQTERVLADKTSRILFLFNTGAANSFLLFALLGTLAFYLYGSLNIMMASILAKTLLFSGICTASRGTNGKNSPVALTVIFTLMLFSSLLYLPASPETRKILAIAMPWIESSVPEIIILAAAGTLCYLPLCVNMAKQYNIKRGENQQ